jgi:hypothetical protein
MLLTITGNAAPMPAMTITSAETIPSLVFCGPK